MHTAKKNWNNHIGLTLTVLETDRDATVSVLEAGMSNKGEIAYLSKIVAPEIALIINIGLSHAESLGGLDEVAEEKISIVEGMNDSSVLIVNEKDPYKDLFVSRAKGKICFFNPDHVDVVTDYGLEGFDFTYKHIPDVIFNCPIPGQHLKLNLAASLVCADMMHIPADIIQEGLNDMKSGLENRMRVFQNKQGVFVIADCYNASLESFQAAFDVLGKTSGRRIAVIGDILELGNIAEHVHRQIGKYIAENKSADLVLCVGEHVSAICLELEGIPYCHFDNKADIWSVLKSEVNAGDSVLVKASNGMGFNVIVECLENGTIG